MFPLILFFLHHCKLTSFLGCTNSCLCTSWIFRLMHLLPVLFPFSSGIGKMLCLIVYYTVYFNMINKDQF